MSDANAEAPRAGAHPAADAPLRSVPDGKGETAIRAAIAGWLEAVRARDLERIVSHYGEGLVAFDAIGPLRFEGVEAYRAHWQACLAMCTSEMLFEFRDLEIRADENLAFAHALLRCGEVSPTGEEHAHWMRMSMGLRRIHGDWKIVHEHSSAPFDVANMKVLDLQPGEVPEMKPPGSEQREGQASDSSMASTRSG